MDIVRLIEWFAPIPLCDWHGGGHSSGVPADPIVDAYVVGFFTAVGIGILASLLSGGLMIVFTRRIRNMFWAIPAVNLALFAIFMLIRPYPGGAAAQFQNRGLTYTLVTLTALLFISLAMALILALIRLVVRAIRSSAQYPHQSQP